MIQVVPAIIPISKDQMTEEFALVSEFAKRVQVDISDGIFTPVKTWPYNEKDVQYFNNLKTENEGWPHWEDVDIELHLMVASPEKVILDWIETGISAVVVQIEAVTDFQTIIDTCRTYEIELGVAIKPSTDIEKLVGFVDQVDFIQCMGSDNMGHHDVALDQRAVMQIEKLHTLYPERIIGIDIGVTPDTARTLVTAGARKLISGGAILEAHNPKEVFLSLENISE